MSQEGFHKILSFFKCGLRRARRSRTSKTRKSSPGAPPSAFLSPPAGSMETSRVDGNSIKPHFFLPLFLGRVGSPSCKEKHPGQHGCTWNSTDVCVPLFLCKEGAKINIMQHHIQMLRQHKETSTVLALTALPSLLLFPCSLLLKVPPFSPSRHIQRDL